MPGSLFEWKSSRMFTDSKNSCADNKKEKNAGLVSNGAVVGTPEGLVSNGSATVTLAVLACDSSATGLSAGLASNDIL